jgi:hypothetical protein
MLEEIEHRLDLLGLSVDQKNHIMVLIRGYAPHADAVPALTLSDPPIAPPPAAPPSPE